MKKICSAVIMLFLFYMSLFSTEFYKNYYIDKFGDKTNEWYLYSEDILGTSPNVLGGKTEFVGKICIDKDTVFFDIKRRNGDTYSGDGFVYIKLKNNEIKVFFVNNYSGSFYPEEKEELRNLILNENKIKVVVEIRNMPYSFNLGTIDLTALHDILKIDKKQVLN